MSFNPFAQATSNAPLLREVFDIPVHQSQTFVLKLEDSTNDTHLRDTLESYVVTEDIARNMHAALEHVEAGLSTGENQGAYLSGSFGSGKSHFMAVLYAILAGEPLTREIPDLQPFVADHPRAVNAELLQLKFHFLGSKTIEDTIFRGYLQQISQLRPETIPPVLHSTGLLFTDAQNMRTSMGDEKFFAKLNDADSMPSGQQKSSAAAAAGIDLSIFGGTQDSTRWDANAFDEARAPSADSESRSALASALTQTIFSSYATGSEWLPLAEGLNEISRHAKSLGYEGVVLLLDELILWLTFMVSEQEMFNRESQKLTLLVESSVGKMAVPVISFIARQHDLAYWQENTLEAGSTMEARRKALQHQEGRFRNIELGSQNLPEIANRRLLTPKPGQTLVLEQAFDRLKLRPEISNVLLDGVNTTDNHQASSMEAFKLVFPFSPALVDTLIHLSPAMQRERTALKVMEKLLVEKRDSMTIDQVIPVGDAFDHIITSDTGAQSQGQSSLIQRFKNGRKFWQEKLRPLIYREAGVDPSTKERDLHKDARGKLRLGKTLIMAALAPEVPSLKAIAASRLVHLNHGSMVNIFQGDDVTSALSTLRGWAGEFPEIIISEDSRDPVITLKLEEVPWEEVIDAARQEDTPQRRLNLVRGFLDDALRVADVKMEADSSLSRNVSWKGTPRTVEVLFGNVRNTAEISNDDFLPNTDGALRIVIDLPFDDPGHTPAEDHRRIETLPLRDQAPFTIVWLPQFFSAEQMSRLGELVIVRRVLEPAGFRDYTARLAGDAATAVRSVLEQRRATLTNQFRTLLAEVYGAASGIQFPENQEPLKSLDPALHLTKPVGTNMAEATDRLIEQAFDHKYPDHPAFNSDKTIRSSDFNHVLTALREAAANRNDRTDLSIEAARATKTILSPLKIANVQESHIVFNADTVGTAMSSINAQLRNVGKDTDGSIKVAELRNAIRAITPRQGLSDLTVDIYVGAWAAFHHRSWYRYNAQIKPPMITEFEGDMQLRPVALPDPESWSAAVQVAQHLFGINVFDHLNGDNLTDLKYQVTDAVDNHRDAAQSLSTELGILSHKLEFGSQTQRIRLAVETRDLVDALNSVRGDSVSLVERLAAAKTGDNRILGASTQEASVSLKEAASATEALRQLNSAQLTNNLTTLKNYTANHPGDDLGAAGILDELENALKAHQFKIQANVAISRFSEQFSQWTSALAQRRSDPLTKPQRANDDVHPEPGFAPLVFERVTNASEVIEQIQRLTSDGTPIKVTIEKLGGS